MRLIKIDILKYKSIKNPFSIVFEEGKIVALIGKNGSGKTNVLEAIKHAFSENQHFTNKKNECKIQYHIELSDEEMENYFSCVDTDKMAKEIIVDFDNVIGRRYIESSAIYIVATEFKLRLDKVIKGFNIATRRYIETLKKFEAKSSSIYYTADIRIETDDGGSFANLEKNLLKYYEGMRTRQVDQLKLMIEEFFEGDRISLDKYERSARFYNKVWDVPLYKIVEKEQIHISPIIARSLNINKKDLEKANVKLNNYLKKINNIFESEYREIQIQLEEFVKIQEEIFSIFDSKWDEWDESNKNIEKKYNSFMQKLKEIVFTNCYYLDNENTLLFSQTDMQGYNIDRQKQYYFLNTHNPIIQTFDAFLHNKGILQWDMSISDVQNIPDKQFSKAIREINNNFLPSIVPKFDNNEIEKFIVDFDNNSLNLYVHEKSGDEVSFNNTSLGRRWYLTYQFIKALLKPGDMFFIDEPAAFLHPQAQIEFKSELKDLAKRGIYVLYSTHSPYLIPEDWGQVYNVNMSKSGTQIYKFESGDDMCDVIKNELGILYSANILFNLEKTIILVEGVVDKICIEKFAKLLNYDLSEYNIHVCDGEAILQVAYMCLKHNIAKIKVVLDNDNKYKNKVYKQGHSMYDACMEIINKNLKNCIYIGEGKKGCLEDLFEEDNNTKFKYYNNQKCRWKVDFKAVENLSSIEDISLKTKDNFEQLFIGLEIPKLDCMNSQ